MIETLWAPREKVAEYKAQGWRVSKTDRERTGHAGLGRGIPPISGLPYL